jgi:xanthine dehydrogenase iron-sulfur cluster and FAD-binding subunit A
MTDQTLTPAHFALNGVSVSLEGVDHNITLLNFIRDAGLTGTKEGCAEGDCGACTVAILTPDASGKPMYQAVNSCLMLAGRLRGLGNPRRFMPCKTPCRVLAAVNAAIAPQVLS